MVGSGIKGQGGAVLVYRSKHINKGEHLPLMQERQVATPVAAVTGCRR